MSEKEKESVPKKKIKESFAVYISSAIGAVFLGFGDLLNHSSDSTLGKIAEMLRTKASFPAEPDPSSMWASLIILIILGVAICWVHRPKERMEGFMMGFSVFALLTAGVPQTESITSTNNAGNRISPAGSIETSPIQSSTPIKSSSISFFISSVSAQEISTTNEKGAITIVLTNKKGKELTQSQTFMVILINQQTQQRKKYQFQGTRFQMVENFGNYKINIAIPDYRSIYTHITINNKKQTAYRLKLESSMLPLGLQQLISSPQKKLQYLSYETLRLRGIQLFEQGKYERAIQQYNKILRKKQNDFRIINYKGYALYRWGKYKEAEKILSQSLIKNPNNLLTRLNLAKTYCQIGDNTKAKNILFKQKQLSLRNKQLICKDKAFTNVCATLKKDCR